MVKGLTLRLYNTDLFNVHFLQIELVSGYRDTQLEVTENVYDMWNLSLNIYQYFKIEGIFHV